MAEQICSMCWWYGKPIDCPADFDVDTKECKNFKHTDIVRIGWSGGKDSTCAVYKHIERGDKVKALCYIPHFTDDIPLINKEHFEFIMRQKSVFEKGGATVFLTKGITYWDYCFSIAKSGKFKGQVKGYPYIGFCGFRRDSKIKACMLDVGTYDYESLGIASDEIARHNQLNENKRSILVEKGITEEMAKEFCQKRNAYSPHYKYSKRDGCALCFNAKPKELEVWLNDYPEAEEILIDLQNRLKPLLVGRKNEFPLRRYKYFI